MWLKRWLNGEQEVEGHLEGNNVLGQILMIEVQIYLLKLLVHLQEKLLL
jgi:hypothetical protein